MFRGEDGGVAGAVGEAHASIAILEGAGYTVHLGRAYLTLGILERRRRRRAASRAALERAREIFVAAQTRLWEDRARQELERSWSPRDPHRLSQNEVRIAQLAADGWSNPQIAQELVCSRRAVEAALSRVYRKVGIHGRAEIATALDPSPTSSRTVNVWTSPISSPPITE